jgi:hypothetical protein
MSLAWSNIEKTLLLLHYGPLGSFSSWEISHGGIRFRGFHDFRQPVIHTVKSVVAQ